MSSVDVTVFRSRGKPQDYIFTFAQWNKWTNTNQARDLFEKAVLRLRACVPPKRKHAFTGRCPWIILCLNWGQNVKVSAQLVKSQSFVWIISPSTILQKQHNASLETCHPHSTVHCLTVYGRSISHTAVLCWSLRAEPFNLYTERRCCVLFLNSSFLQQVSEAVHIGAAEIG